MKLSSLFKPQYGGPYGDIKGSWYCFSQTLRTRLKEIPDRIHFATARDMDSEEEIQAFFTESVDASCEGEGVAEVLWCS